MPYVKIGQLTSATDPVVASFIDSNGPTGQAIDRRVGPVAEASAAAFLATSPAVAAAAAAAAGPAVDAKLAQAGGITTPNLADKSVTAIKAAFIAAGKNLYLGVGDSVGFSLNPDTGATAALAAYRVTDYIPVVAGQSYTFSNPRHVVWYSATKVYNSGINNANNPPVTAVAPVTGFVRATIADAFLGSFQIEAGTIRTPFEAASLRIPGLVVDNGQVGNSTNAVVGNKNLYTGQGDQVGFSVNAANGTLGAIAGYRATDYIPVVLGQSYTLSGPRTFAWYGPTKVFNAGVDNAGLPTVTVVAPITGYLRATIPDAGLPTFQIEQAAAASFFEAFRLVGAAPRLTVTKAGDALAIGSPFGAASSLVQNVSKSSSSNGCFGMIGSYLDGVLVHDTSDDVTPLRTSISTIGANHGYSTIGVYTQAGHLKTAVDLGSIYTDGARQYTLLKISGNDLTFGGSYAVAGGIVSTAQVAPAAALTYVSGGAGTHQAAVPITGPVAGAQLYPSTNNRSVGYFLDGTELTSDRTSFGDVLEVRETYTVMDYKAIIDWAQANPGKSYANDLVGGVLKISNTFRFTPGGKCLVSTSWKALTAVTLLNCGCVQSAVMSKAGSTIWRYMPGVLAKGGFDFSVPIDMSAYATSLTFGPADYVDATKPPSRFVDWMKTGGVPLIGFTMGYITDKTNAKNSSRAALATGWDMRSTKKVYPIAFAGTLAAGDYRTFESYRNYLAPTPTVGDTNHNLVTDDAATYAFVDYHSTVTAQSVPAPGLIGKSITVLDSSNFTLLNDTVDTEGLVFSTTGGKGYAVLKLT